MDSQPQRHIFVLTVQDPVVGAATVPVGVLGFSANASVVSWLPGADMAGWTQRVALLDEAEDKAAMVEEWQERSNGIAWALQEVTSDSAGDLRSAVEDALDGVLATPG